MAKNVENFFMYLLAIFTSSYDKCSVPVPIYWLTYFLFVV
jgi:hypothetical protein